MLTCPCGAPAPEPLPGPGCAPAPCARCATPLVRSGAVPAPAAERALGAALLVAAVSAVGWMLAAKATGTGAYWSLPIAGAGVGLASAMAARARGGRVQAAAACGFLIFLALGEVLIYRSALLPRLVALHSAEGASDAEILARTELDRMDVAQFLHIELTVGLFVGLAIGLAVALLLNRAPPAVVAFHKRVPPPAAPEPVSQLPAEPLADVEMPLAQHDEQVDGEQVEHGHHDDEDEL